MTQAPACAHCQAQNAPLKRRPQEQGGGYICRSLTACLRRRQHNRKAT